jgi:uncharacterized protein (UPF0216 family)
MKLNYDCIRKILLYIEVNSGYEPNTTIYKIIQPKIISEALYKDKFTEEEIKLLKLIRHLRYSKKHNPHYLY